MHLAENLANLYTPGIGKSFLISGKSSFTRPSVQFSRSVVSDSLWPHEPQHARPPCPLPTSRIYPNPCPSSRWCHPTISSSVVPFFSHLQSFPTSGTFQMSQFFASAGQSIGVSASTSVLPMNTQDWSSLGWTGWINLATSIFFFNILLVALLSYHCKVLSAMPKIISLWPFTEKVPDLWSTK